MDEQVLNEVTYEYLPHRGISRETMAHFKCRTKINAEGRPVEVNYPWGPAVQRRFLDARTKDDRFRWQGDASQATLFLKGCFSAAEARAVTITEGADDALAVYEMLGRKYPVHSVRSASSARKDCAAEYDYLNSFEKIYLALDSDEPGKKAAQEIAGLFDFNKVYDVSLTRKDAQEYLQAGEQEKFKNIWWNARRYLPAGIISSYSEIDRIVDEDKIREGAPYPFPTLQDMTYGIRSGESILLTGLEGLGKTEVLRAIEYGVAKGTDANIGIIHCEENKGRIIKGFAGYELRLPAHLPDSTVSDDEIKRAYREVSKRDERIHIYSHFDSADPDSILDNIRFMATACDCKYIFLDHISWLVSGQEVDDERKKLDYLSTKMAAMAEDRDFTMFVVSHVNDEGLTRGSRNISKVADLWLHLDRNLTAPTQDERNVTHLTIKKNRFSGKTGPAGKLYFDPSTFVLTELRPATEPPVE